MTTPVDQYIGLAEYEAFSALYLAEQVESVYVAFVLSLTNVGTLEAYASLAENIALGLIGPTLTYAENTAFGVVYNYPSLIAEANSAALSAESTALATESYYYYYALGALVGPEALATGLVNTVYYTALNEVAYAQATANGLPAFATATLDGTIGTVTTNPTVVSTQYTVNQTVATVLNTLTVANLTAIATQYENLALSEVASLQQTATNLQNTVLATVGPYQTTVTNLANSTLATATTTIASTQATVTAAVNNEIASYPTQLAGLETQVTNAVASAQATVAALQAQYVTPQVTAAMAEVTAAQTVANSTITTAQGIVANPGPTETYIQATIAAAVATATLAAATEVAAVEALVASLEANPTVVSTLSTINTTIAPYVNTVNGAILLAQSTANGVVNGIPGMITAAQTAAAAEQTAFNNEVATLEATYVTPNVTAAMTLATALQAQVTTTANGLIATATTETATVLATITAEATAAQALVAASPGAEETIVANMAAAIGTALAPYAAAVTAIAAAGATMVGSVQAQVAAALAVKPMFYGVCSCTGGSSMAVSSGTEVTPSGQSSIVTTASTLACNPGTFNVVGVGTLATLNTVSSLSCTGTLGGGFFVYSSQINCVGTAAEQIAASAAPTVGASESISGTSTLNVSAPLVTGMATTACVGTSSLACSASTTPLSATSVSIVGDATMNVSGYNLLVTALPGNSGIVGAATETVSGYSATNVVIASESITTTSTLTATAVKLSPIGTEGPVLVISAPDTVVSGSIVSVRVQALDASGTRLAFVGPPSVRIYNFDVYGNESNLVPYTTTTQTGQSYTFIWQVTGLGPYVIEGSGTTSTLGNVIGVETVLVQQSSGAPTATVPVQGGVIA